MNTKICAQCGKSFEYKRDSAVYCSNKCRKDASRGSVSVTDKTLSVPEKELSVTKSGHKWKWEDYTWDSKVLEHGGWVAPDGSVIEVSQHMELQ